MVAESKKFKVGDKVIATCDTPRTSEGFIGYVVGNSSRFGYSVREVGSITIEYFEEGELELLSVAQDKKPYAVNSPKHYAVFEQLEAIEVIASSMTVDQFYGYCLGNILKYRLRAGGKDDVMQELGKADKYQELFTQFKFLCKDAA